MIIVLLCFSPNPPIPHYLTPFPFPSICLSVPPSYRARAQKLSEIHKDQPGHPVSRAVYWISYILRHHGAEHLRSTVYSVPTYQYFLLDVAMVIGAGLLLICYCMYRINRFLQSWLRRAPVSAEKANGHCHNGIPNGKYKRNGHVKTMEKKLK